MKESSIVLKTGARYVFPYYVSNGSVLIDVRSESRVLDISGVIVAVDPYEITAKISDYKILITNFRDKLLKREMKIGVADTGGKWHRATHFEDIFVEFHGSMLLLINEK
jgi:hypothetical protein